MMPQAKDAGSESELRSSVSSSSSEAMVSLQGAVEPDCGSTPTLFEGSDDEPSQVRDDELLVAHGERRGRNFTPTVVVDSDEEFATQVLSCGLASARDSALTDLTEALAQCPAFEPPAAGPSQVLVCCRLLGHLNTYYQSELMPFSNKHFLICFNFIFDKNQKIQICQNNH